MDKKSNNAIATTWISGNSSTTLVIPKAIAKEYGLETPSRVVIEKRKEGLLVRKLEI